MRQTIYRHGGSSRHRKFSQVLEGTHLFRAYLWSKDFSIQFPSPLYCAAFLLLHSCCSAFFASLLCCLSVFLSAFLLPCFSAFIFSSVIFLLFASLLVCFSSLLLLCIFCFIVYRLYAYLLYCFLLFLFLCFSPSLYFLCPCFSRMHSQGSRFTLGGWGLRACSPDVAEPFAIVGHDSR